jgi:ABC-type transport system substrate-binding protein
MKSLPKRNRNKNVTHFLVPLCVGLLFSCQPKPQVGLEDTQVLNFAVASNIKGLDPANADDLYSNIVIQEVYEGLYAYSYLKRPVVLEPALATSMPKISKDGLIYEIDIKPGVHFIDDPCFEATGGKGREVVAEDFVYSIKRHGDVKVRSTGWWLFQNRIRGFDAFNLASKSDAPTNYDMLVDGLQATGKYQLTIKLEKPYPQLLYALAMAYGMVVAKEAVLKYGEEFINHPVGTGPFKLKSWRRGLRVELDRNKNYRQVLYPDQGEADDAAKGLLADKGKRVPFADKVILHIYRESQPLWLNFMRGNLDAAGIPKDNFDDSIDKDGKMKPALARKGIELWKYAYPDVTYAIFNMDDPILGKQPAVRKAMSLGFDTQKRIDLLYNGRALASHGPIPPGLSGYDPNFKNPYKEYNPEKAKEILAAAGFPNGKGLPVFEYETIASTTSRQFDELFKREMEAIGIRIKFNSNTWPEMTAKINQGKAQISSMGWHADYPDAENFLALFYGPNKAPGVNAANYSSKKFDALYEQVRIMADSPERNVLFKKMVAIITEDVPWIFGVHRLAYSLRQGWLLNYKPHPIGRGMMKYYRIDSSLKSELLTKF